MWGTLVDDTSGVSELYGTVLMVSFALLMAIFLLGTGTVLLGELSMGAEDAIGQDAMLEMDDRLTDIAASGVDATTTFTLPEGEGGDLSFHPVDGVVNVTVYATVSEDELLDADGTSGSIEIPLGTVQYVDSDGHATAYQGGAVFRRQDGYTDILSRPAVDFDGERLALSFIDLTSLDSVRADSEIHARYLANDSRTRSDELYEMLSSYWTLGSDSEVYGIAPVHVDVTIESEFAEGWKRYALEGFREPLDDEDVHLDEDRVTLQFTIGGELTVGSEPSDFGGPEADIPLYSGPSQFAQYNTHLEPVDGGPAFRLDETKTNPKNAGIGLYHDNPRGDDGWVLFRANLETWESATIDGDWNVDDLPVVGGDVAPGVHDHDGGGFEYHVEPDQLVCVFDPQAGQSENMDDWCEEKVFQISDDVDPIDVDVELVVGEL